MKMNKERLWKAYIDEAMESVNAEIAKYNDSDKIGKLVIDRVKHRPYNIWGVCKVVYTSSNGEVKTNDFDGYLFFDFIMPSAPLTLEWWDECFNDYIEAFKLRLDDYLYSDDSQDELYDAFIKEDLIKEVEEFVESEQERVMEIKDKLYEDYNLDDKGIDLKLALIYDGDDDLHITHRINWSDSIADYIHEEWGDEEETDYYLRDKNLDVDDNPLKIDFYKESITNSNDVGHVINYNITEYRDAIRKYVNDAVFYFKAKVEYISDIADEIAIHDYKESDEYKSVEAICYKCLHELEAEYEAKGYEFMCSVGFHDIGVFEVGLVVKASLKEGLIDVTNKATIKDDMRKIFEDSLKYARRHYND